MASTTSYLTTLPPQLIVPHDHPLLVILNEQQREAARHGAGTCLCCAGPGSGKTAVLIRRVALLIEAGVDPACLLAVTFTNKAARELKTRLAGMVGAEVARTITVGTFHSLCARWLRRDAPIIGRRGDFTIYDQADSDRVIAGLFKALNLDTKGGKVPAMRERISRWKNDLITPEQAERRTNPRDPTDQRALQFYVEYERILKRNNAFDFDDLLMKFVQVLKADPHALRRYQRTWLAVSCDEVQDNNACQHELLLLLTGAHENLFVIGDQSQSIYRFRGAMPDSLRLLHQARRQATLYRLGKNYRSTQVIVAAGQAIINTASPKDRQYSTDLWTENGVGDPIQLVTAYDQDDEAEQIADAITADLRVGGKPGDWAVLYRVNAQSRAVEQALIRRRIRHQIIGGIAFFERAEVKDVLAYLRLIANPMDDVAVQRACNTPTRGLGDKTVEQLIQAAKDQERGLLELMFEQRDRPLAQPSLKPRARAAVVAFVDVVDWLRTRAERLDVVNLLVELLDKIQFQAYLAKEYGRDEAEDRRLNVQELVASAAPFVESHIQEEQLSAFLDDVALLTDSDVAGEGDDAVKLMTLHKAKGLEFPKVWLPGIEEGLLPYHRAATEDDVAEERRLFFVGVTRAMHLLTISTTLYRRLYQERHPAQPSRFLKAIPENLFGLR